ncbi:MAG: hypothetical protein ACPIOQ_34020, partial [Promethearchaeia archaeon]
PTYRNFPIESQHETQNSILRIVPALTASTFWKRATATKRALMMAVCMIEPLLGAVDQKMVRESLLTPPR